MGCTTNIAWYKDTNGNGVYDSGVDETWGVTAAHCLPNRTGYVSGTFALANMNWYQGTDIDINSSGTSTTYFVYGNEMDMAVVQLDRGAVKDTIYWERPLPNGTKELLSRRMGWFHWHPTMDLPRRDTPSGPLPGYTICHAGKSSNTERCGELRTRTHSINHTAASSGIGVAINLNNLHRVEGGNAGGFNGDSGGTVWHDQGGGGDRNIVGVFHGGSSTSTVYSHVSYLKSIFGLKAPVEMS